jgi:hypothetical protein
VVLTAAAGVWFGREQLIRVAEESRRQGDVARADLMLQIDQIFEGAEVGQSRLEIRTLRNECEAEIKAKPGANMTVSEVISASGPLFSARVTALYLAYKSPEKPGTTATTGDPPHVKAGREYAVLMKLPYWMETVGLLTRKNLLHKDDMLDLYDALFIDTLTCFDEHLDHRRDEDDPDRRFLENATWFRDEGRRRLARQSVPRRSPFG